MYVRKILFRSLVTVFCSIVVVIFVFVFHFSENVLHNNIYSPLKNDRNNKRHFVLSLSLPMLNVRIECSLCSSLFSVYSKIWSKIEDKCRANWREGKRITHTVHSCIFIWQFGWCSSRSHFKSHSCLCQTV